jgi:hypothetical protein
VRWLTDEQIFFFAGVIVPPHLLHFGFFLLRNLEIILPLVLLRLVVLLEFVLLLRNFDSFDLTEADRMRDELGVVSNQLLELVGG